MDLPTERYLDQVERLRADPCEAIGSWNEEALVGYYVVDSGTVECQGSSTALVSALTTDRSTTWIRTSFLWTMHHAQWGSRPGLDNILLLRIPRNHAGHLLASAHETNLDMDRDRMFPNQWKGTVQVEDAICQEDPDRGADGERTERRTLQIGVRRRAAIAFAAACGDAVEDITPWVRAQGRVVSEGRIEDLLVPRQGLLSRLWT